MWHMHHFTASWLPLSNAQAERIVAEGTLVLVFCVRSVNLLQHLLEIDVGIWLGNEGILGFFSPHMPISAGNNHTQGGEFLPNNGRQLLAAHPGQTEIRAHHIERTAVGQKRKRLLAARRRLDDATQAS